MGFKKGQKITDEATLERLKVARLKAMETRKRNSEAKKDIKLAKELENKKELEAAQNKIKSSIKEPGITSKSENNSQPEREQSLIVPFIEKKYVKKSKKKPVIVVESDSETSSSSSDDEQPQVIIKKSKKKDKVSKTEEKPNAVPPTYHDVLNSDPHFHKTFKSLFPEF